MVVQKIEKTKNTTKIRNPRAERKARVARRASNEILLSPPNFELLYHVIKNLCTFLYVGKYIYIPTYLC